MENTVSKDLRVLPGHQVRAQPRETVVTPGSQVLTDRLVQRENQDALQAPGFPVVLVLKEFVVILVLMELLVSRGFPVTPVSSGTKDLRDNEGFRDGRVCPDRQVLP